MTYPLFPLTPSIIIEYTPTVADNSEASDVKSLFLDENSHQCHVQNHALHEHPHEGGEEPVVEEDSYG